MAKPISPTNPGRMKDVCLKVNGMVMAQALLGLYFAVTARQRRFLKDTANHTTVSGLGVARHAASGWWDCRYLAQAKLDAVVVLLDEACQLGVSGLHMPEVHLQGCRAVKLLCLQMGTGESRQGAHRVGCKCKIVTSGRLQAPHM